MSAEYVTKLIRRAVDANTAENAPTSSRALNKYFGDPKLAEIGMLISKFKFSHRKFCILVWGISY
jgi:hypothetical protein